MRGIGIHFIIVCLSFSPDLIFLSSQNKPVDGDPLPLFKALDIYGKPVSPFGDKSQYVLLLFFDPANNSHKFILSYAQILADRYISYGLQVIGISNVSKKKTS